MTTANLTGLLKDILNAVFLLVSKILSSIKNKPLPTEETVDKFSREKTKKDLSNAISVTDTENIKEDAVEQNKEGSIQNSAGDSNTSAQEYATPLKNEIISGLAEWSYHNDLPRVYFKELLFYEGGYSNHPNDKGGKTNLGITEGTLNSAKQKGLVPQDVTIHEVAPEHAYIIYNVMYYKAGRCDILPHPLAFIHFDACVNHGIGGAVKNMLQPLLNSLGANLKADGVIGPKTLEAVNTIINAQKAMPARQLALLYWSMRSEYYQRIIRNNPGMKVFEKGWANRMARVKEFILGARG